MIFYILSKLTGGKLIMNQKYLQGISSNMKDQDEAKRERIISRILFGSDFSVNLFKVESYTEYFSIFESSGFTDEDIERIAEKNTLKFLSLE